MEVLILLIIIVYGISRLGNSDCEHDWLYDGANKHKCTKCGKREACSKEYNLHAMTYDCTECQGLVY